MNKSPTPQNSRWKTAAKAGLFALPFLAIVGIYVAGQLPDHLWSRTDDFIHDLMHGSLFAGNDKPIVLKSGFAKAPPIGPVNGHPETAVQPAHQLRSMGVPPQALTRPLVALPAWHSFPDLPPGLQAKGPVGARLLLLVASDGSVADASVIESSGLGWLDQQAIDWVKAHWRYQPAMQGKRAVETATAAIILFRVKKNGGRTRRYNH